MEEGLDPIQNLANELDEDGKVSEWEDGLPDDDDLTPLSQLLVPPDLASAFSITPEPIRTILDVHTASQNTLTSIRRSNSVNSSSDLKSASPVDDTMLTEDPVSPSAKRYEGENSNSPEDLDSSSQAMKRPRLVWTPNLHKRFVDVVDHIGIKNAVPKTIMQLMNVEGLTRENVASHLQKYRLFLKRKHGYSGEIDSGSDPLFESTPAPQQQQQQGMPVPVPVPMPYAMPGMMPVPMYGMVPMNHGHIHGYGEQRTSKDWGNRSKFSPSAVNYSHHVSPNPNDH